MARVRLLEATVVARVDGVVATASSAAVHSAVWYGR